MRYSLHTIGGRRIGEAETAQEIADMARPGQYAYDTAPDAFYRVTAFYALDPANGELLGAMFRYRYEAVDFLRSADTRE